MSRRSVDFTIIRFCILFFIGLANALPIPLSGSVLSIWLSEAGFEKDLIGLFALLGLPLTIKCLWSLPINTFTLPFFRSSPRKGWMIFALLGMILSLLGMSFINPSDNPWTLAFCLVVLSSFTGCLYIVGLSYELESVSEKDYSVGSAFVVTGYRIGLLCAGAGALYLSYLWDWSWMFRCMSLLLALGCLFILMQPEPHRSKETLEAKRQQFIHYQSFFHGFWHEIIVQPCKCFFQRKDWKLILLIILTFKLGDHLAKSMTGPFYLSLGFNKADLALASKMWGFAATILGALAAGYYFKGKDPLSASVTTGLIHACTLGCYYVLSLIGKSFSGLYITVALENFTGGMAMTTFIFLLWRVCDKRYAPLQYALLWSFFSFKSDILACVGGLLATFCAWNIFFLLIFTVGLLSAVVVWNKLRIREECFKKEKPIPGGVFAVSPGFQPGVRK
jgi:MFS transporter, PAT family, beta-lactamase induction signal transducer AmpG